MIPKFNSATLFLSRPHNVWHRVSQVNNQLSSGKKKKKPRRYAITSWYATSDDKIDQEYLEECNKMISVLETVYSVTFLIIFITLCVIMFTSKF